MKLFAIHLTLICITRHASTTDLSRYKDRLEDASLFVSNIGKKKKKHKKITVIDRKILSPAPS
jgi:hypothetical protein